MIVATIAIATQAAAYAGRETEDGKDAKYWEDHCVIYARVVSIRDDGADGAVLKIEPRATLTGNLDCGRYSTRYVRAFAGANSSIRAYPRADTMTIVVLQGKDGYYSVPSSNTSYMPHGSALMEVKAFDDPGVAKLLNILQEIKADISKADESSGKKK